MERAVVREGTGRGHRDRRARRSAGDGSGIESPAIFGRGMDVGVVVPPGHGLPDTEGRGGGRERHAALVAEDGDDEVCGTRGGGDGRRRGGGVRGRGGGRAAASATRDEHGQDQYQARKTKEAHWISQNRAAFAPPRPT